MTEPTAVTSSIHIRSPLARAVHQKLLEDNAVEDRTAVKIIDHTRLCIQVALTDLSSILLVYYTKGIKYIHTYNTNTQ